jgi:phosphate transport system permease protein
LRAGRDAWRRLTNIAGVSLLVLGAILAVAPLLHIVAVIAVKGARAIWSIGLGTFLTETPHPFSPGSPGGIGPALLGTVELATLTAALTTLLGLPTAVLVSEFRGSMLSRATTLLALTLVEFPTILVGLTVYAVMVDHLVGRYNMLAGALALSLVILPYVVVQSSEALRQVPRSVREAAYSLGAPRTTTVYSLIAPVARRGILVGLLVGLARAAGETAPLLFTIGGAYGGYHACLLEEGGAVPLLIYQFIQMPYTAAHELAWGASLILLVIVVAIMLVARILVREVKI